MASSDPVYFPNIAWQLGIGVSALIVIDAENDFLHPEGWYGTHGVDISHMHRTIEPTRALVHSTRAKRIPIIWTRHGFHNFTWSPSPKCFLERTIAKTVISNGQ